MSWSTRKETINYVVSANIIFGKLVIDWIRKNAVSMASEESYDSITFDGQTNDEMMQQIEYFIKHEITINSTCTRVYIIHPTLSDTRFSEFIDLKSAIIDIIDEYKNFINNKQYQYRKVLTDIKDIGFRLPYSKIVDLQRLNKK